MGKGRKGRVAGSRKAKLEPPMTLEQLKEIEEQMNSILLRKGVEVEIEDKDNKPLSVSDLSELTTYGWYKPDTNPLPPIPEYPYSNKRLP